MAGDKPAFVFPSGGASPAVGGDWLLVIVLRAQATRGLLKNIFSIDGSRFCPWLIGAAAVLVKSSYGSQESNLCGQCVQRAKFEIAKKISNSSRHISESEVMAKPRRKAA